MQAYYDMIFKRKSVRRFDPALSVGREEMQAVLRQFERLSPLNPDIRAAYRIVPSGQTTCKQGEYCLEFYGEHTQRGLLNAGYLLEQMDLFLASMDIGVCWRGIGRPDVKEWDELTYVIMLAFGKSRPEDFRKNVAKASRKPIETIWQGDFCGDIAITAHYAPSACNMQPWRVQMSGNEIHVYRTTDVRSAIMPPPKRPYYNTIDLGIFLCFLELSLTHGGRAFQRALFDAPLKDSRSRPLVPVADYALL